MKKLFLIVCLAIIMAGCTHEIKNGYVVGKEYSPEHTEIKYNVCLKMVQSKRIPGRYLVWVADSVSVQCIEMNKGIFDSLNVGDYYNAEAWQRNN